MRFIQKQLRGVNVPGSENLRNKTQLTRNDSVRWWGPIKKWKRDNFPLLKLSSSAMLMHDDHPALRK